MEELDNKNIGQIRFEFDDASWFILDHQTLKHVKPETKLELDFAISKVYEEIQTARDKAKEKKGGSDLGINTNDDIDSKDVFGGQ